MTSEPKSRERELKLTLDDPREEEKIVAFLASLRYRRAVMKKPKPKNFHKLRTILGAGG